MEEGFGVMYNCVEELLNCKNRDALFKSFYMFHSPCWKLTKSGVRVSTL
jgi:hypothetical protein